MSDTQHTPGTWVIGRNPVAHLGFTIGVPASEAMPPESQRHIGNVFSAADARLIAASPEMLDALEHIEWAVTGFGDFEAQYPEAIAAVRAAITKATGQTLWRPTKVTGMSL